MRGHADELDVEIVQPLRVTLVQALRAPRLFLVVVHQSADPALRHPALTQIRRVADHAHDGHVVLDRVGALGLGRQPASKGKRLVRRLAFLKAVGQIDRQTRRVGGGHIAQLGQDHVQLHVAHGIGRHEQLESVQAGNQVGLDVA